MAHPQYAFQHSVLFIDDQAKYQNLIRTGLLSYPVHFEFCPGLLTEAIQAVEKGAHDILVVSLQFQDGLVLDFARHVQKHFKNISSIYMVEPHLEDLKEQVMLDGAAGSFQRPDSTQELIHQVQTAVHTSQAQARMRRSHALVS